MAKLVSGEPVLNPFTVRVDNREQLAWTFGGMKARNIPKSTAPGGVLPMLIVPTEWGTLDTGDYSIVGMENHVTIERKSLADAYGTFGRDRERFERELGRMQAMACPNVVIEAELSGILGRDCDGCLGVGRVPVEPSKTRPVNDRGADRGALHMYLRIDRALFNAVSGKSAAEFLRHCLRESNNGRMPEEIIPCQKCGGSGKLHPVENSHLSPKSVFGSIMAWRQRYPAVHWWFCPGRAAAERVAFEILDRFWRNQTLDGRLTKALSTEAGSLSGPVPGTGAVNAAQ